MSTAANKKLVQQVYADSANRSGTTFADNLADDASWIVTGQYSWSHEFRGREAILDGLMGHFRSLFTVRPRTVAFNFIADGDFVAVEARGDNVTRDGLRYDNQYCMVFRIENPRSSRSRNTAIQPWSSACSDRSRRSERSRLRFERLRALARRISQHASKRSSCPALCRASTS